MKNYPGKRSMAVTALAAAAATGLAACGSNSGGSAAAPTQTVTATVTAHAAAMTSSAKHVSPAQVSLSKAMRMLWDQHMEWTYATVAAFASGSPGFQATLDRLLQNQTDIGNAIKPYYGDKAGNELTTLLRAHIMGYVPVLQDAKAGDSAGVTKAFANVLANGVQIGKFLEQANPKNWPAPTMEDMMTTHNKQTLSYAALQLQGKYPQSIAGYGVAEAHMQDMADMLTAGIVAQFPSDFH